MPLLGASTAALLTVALCRCGGVAVERRGDGGDDAGRRDADVTVDGDGRRDVDVWDSGRAIDAPESADDGGRLDATAVLDGSDWEGWTDGCAAMAAFSASVGWGATGAAVRLDDPAPGVVTLDMSGLAEAVFRLEVCDPSGWVLDIADSPSANGWSGDSGTFSNDAEIDLNTSTLGIYPNDYGRETTEVISHTDFASPSGCTEQELVVADQRISSPTAGFEHASEHYLRIDPPSDAEGSPDALWYVSVTRTLGSPDRSGTGMTRLAVCLR